MGSGREDIPVDDLLIDIENGKLNIGNGGGGGGEVTLVDDLLIDILLRLPAKSLVRFKCVCKKWYHLIENPNFITNHLHHPNNRTRLFTFHSHYIFSQADGSIIRDVAFTLFPDETLSVRQDINNPLISRGHHHNSTIWQVLGPINGLFVIQYSTDSVNADFVALWNPSTTEFRELPLPSFNLPPDLHYSESKFGFGSTKDNDDIKLVWINQFSAGPEDALEFPSIVDADVALYSLAHDSWRPIEHNALVPCIIDGTIDVSSFTYLNGAYYWSVNALNPKIVLFDTGSEVFREVQLPPPLLLDNDIFKEESSFFLKQLLLHNESIVCIVSERSGHGTIVESVNIWKMKEEGCWTKLFSFVPSSTSAHLSTTPLGFWKNDELLIHEEGKQLYLYNTNNDEIRDLGIQARQVRVFDYMESLVSVKEGRVGNDDILQ